MVGHWNILLIKRGELRPLLQVKTCNSYSYSSCNIFCDGNGEGLIYCADPRTQVDHLMVDPTRGSDRGPTGDPRETGPMMCGHPLGPLPSVRSEGEITVFVRKNQIWLRLIAGPTI